jgi:ribosomal-protein-alanine N-acetyltransferase
MNLQKSYHSREIEKMKLEHLDAVVLLEHESFTTPWPRVSFELLLNSSNVDGLVVWQEGTLLGYLIASERDGEYLIANVAVGKQCRRHGLATELVEKSLQMGKERGAALAVLEVRESNDAAIKLYEYLGFRIVEKHAGYYSSPPEDALVMARRL